MLGESRDVVVDQLGQAKAKEDGRPGRFQVIKAFDHEVPAQVPRAMKADGAHARHPAAEESTETRGQAPGMLGTMRPGPRQRRVSARGMRESTDREEAGENPLAQGQGKTSRAISSAQMAREC